ncbi:MAG: hypothetical protein D3923_12530, partial [Candidatus Electrothrix sp. AR3]|nr:hypothetical protein [Candidatus Electrothrix sp. AR3]
MLHAVNGGFYFENKNQFCCTAALDGAGNCAAPPANGVCASGPNLGEEVWAYIPYNLQPHLKCLANKFYAHKYFVDQKPRIFDVQIFQEDADHVGGWGTILVGSMRFGGAPVLAETLDDGNEDGIDDKREFTSSFFILDITNPDKDPVLLGEMTRTTDGGYVDLNYTTSAPSMIIMRDGFPTSATEGNTKTEWYLAMGNGPAEMDGTNSSGKKGTLAILPLEWLAGKATNWSAGIPTAINPASKQAFRIVDTAPSQGGSYSVPLEHDGGYISDIISVDYNINISAADELGARYRTDALYFGTVDGTDFKPYPDAYLNGLADQTYWNGGGRVFRMVTKMLETKTIDGEQVLEERASTPSEWPSAWSNQDHPFRMLADVKMPVVAAPSIGYDGDNYWVYAGTGRFYDEKDKTDNGWCINSPCNADGSRSKVSMFGFKEPFKDATSSFDDWQNIPPSTVNVTCDDSLMTWGTIDWDINADDNQNDDLDDNDPPGQRGLMQTDNILVGLGTGYLYCYHCKTNPNNPAQFQCTALPETDCFPDGDTGPIYDTELEQYTFDKLRTYIAGTGCLTDKSTGLDGWYHAFHDDRERNLGTSTLLG